MLVHLVLEPSAGHGPGGTVPIRGDGRLTCAQVGASAGRLAHARLAGGVRRVGCCAASFRIAGHKICKTGRS